MIRGKGAAMIKARIVQTSKTAMQSGRATDGEWHLEFEPAESQRADPLMGWAGSRDTRRQLNLRFASLEAAKAYAAEKGIAVTVVPAAAKALKIQAYADNFR